jgi:hypothetical protein
MPLENLYHKARYGQIADEKFFAEKRKISPVFPSVADAAERKRVFWETVVARTRGRWRVARGLLRLRNWNGRDRGRAARLRRDVLLGGQSSVQAERGL